MGTTPKYGLPYPEPSTLITESAAIVKSLAEKIDAALSAVAPSDSYTIPGTIVGNFTTSGTFTPPPGVSVVHVVVVSGGGNGLDLSNTGYPGGSGGGVRVYRSVPVSGPVAVSVGGAATASSFGALTAPAGFTATDYLLGAGSPNLIASGIPGTRPSAGGPSPHWNDAHRPGGNGVQINGTYYAGGGGGGALNMGASGASVAGGQGGGGKGVNGNGSGSPALFATAGAPSTGGGGGGGYPTSSGGSGRVLIFTEQTTRARGGPALFGDNIPDTYAALDAAGVLLGVYAADSADPQVPGVDLEHLIPYPTDPIPTGRTVTIPAGILGPDPVDVPETAWPVAGWTYTPADGWKEPTP